MKREVSSTPSELAEISDEDELVTTSICPRQTNQSIQSVDPSLKSWIGSVQKHSWEHLPNCMKFIAKNGCAGNRPVIWARRTLDHLSPNATPEQLIHILNGYADLYKLVLYVIWINDNILVGEKDIRTFSGTSSDIEQQKRHRNIAFIMYNSENSTFAPLYTTHKDGHPQTCFATDDKRIIDNIVCLFRQWNQEMSQRAAIELNHISDNNDATENTNESQKTNNLDVLLSSKSLAQNEPVLTTSKTRENDIRHPSQTIIQSNFQSSDTQINRNLEDPTITFSNSSSGANLTVNKVCQNLNHMSELINHVKRLSEKVDDIPSMETDDRHLPTDNTLNGQEVTTEHDMINAVKNKSANTKRHVPSSDKHHPDTSICLLRSTTEPTKIITTPNDLRISVPAQSLDPPNVKKHPYRYRRVRMLKDLAYKGCPFVQAGEKKSQRLYPVVEVPSDEEFHLRVRAVTENHHSHPYTTVVPENATVDWKLMKDNNERTCLQYDSDSFDPILQCVYLPITPNERKERQKIIKVRLLNWKHYGPTNREVIEHENLRLCRLEFHLCTRIAPGEYELVSQPSYTTVIEQQDGDVMIDSDNVTPKQLCELGGEKISMPLSVKCPKKGLSIESNGDELPTKDFTIERKILSFTSPPKKTGTDDLHIIVKRKEYAHDTSTQEEFQLYEDFLPYVAHGPCNHICPP